MHVFSLLLVQAADNEIQWMLTLEIRPTQYSEHFSGELFKLLCMTNKYLELNKNAYIPFWLIAWG